MSNFSGDPKTKWLASRNMELLEALSYTDPSSKVWTAPQGATLNGATIPRSLWSAIGSPYVGKYRRASIIHDYFVGEGSNPNVSISARKKADKMFYHACREDGCSRKFSALLYIGVRFGTWSSRVRPKMMGISPLDAEFIRTSNEDDYERNSFWAIADSAADLLNSEDVDALEAFVDEKLPE